MSGLKAYNKPVLIPGGIYSDERGIIRFVNEFDVSPVRRFYTVENKDITIIRAWQAHRHETKYFHALSGSFVIAWVKPDDFINPSPLLVADFRIITAGKPEVLVVPGGYANGIKALENSSVLLVMSDKTLEESSQDMYRFDPSLWFDWNSPAL